jgi:hypothetical protein
MAESSFNSIFGLTTMTSLNDAELLLLQWPFFLCSWFLDYG